jgi:transposase
MARNPSPLETAPPRQGPALPLPPEPCRLPRRPRTARLPTAGFAALEKKLQARVAELHGTEAACPVEVWAFDEHRLGLKPILRKVWAPRGCRPIASGHHRYQWLYLYGFVRPATGQVVWFIADGVNTALFSALLASFATEIGAGPNKHIILVLDGAGWHVSKDLEVPEGVELMFLPPYSPQIQPAERLWPLTNEPIVNEYFETLDELDEVLAERCRILADDSDQIRAHTLFEWWPQHN